MITSIFSKSKPVNFVIVAVAVILLFIITNLEANDFKALTIFDYALRLLIALFFVVLLDFVIAKNDLSKKNSYGIMILLLLFISFPETLKNTNILLSALFVFFALRRILSLYTKRNIKKKFFDSTFWIALATICFPWSAFFFIVVGLAIAFYWQNDVKNIVVAFLGLLTVFVLMVIYSVLSSNNYIPPLLFNFEVSLDFSYFNNPSKIYALTVMISIYFWSLFYYFRQISSINKKAKPKFILVAITSLVALALVIVVPEKNGSELLFLFVSFSIIIANYIENVSVKWFKEVIATLFLAIPLLRLFL